MSERPNRFLVKISGEALMGGQSFGIAVPMLEQVARDVAAVAEHHEIAIVVGGGNFFRGIQGERRGFRRTTGDAMGRLATTMNALALADAITAAGRAASAFSAEPMPTFCQQYTIRDADAALAQRRVAVLAGGVGAPFFTTDSGAALRAIELDCKAMLKATNVDGVYDCDPRTNPGARRYETLSHSEAIARRLGVMDTAAFALARENALTIIVFSLHEPGAIAAAVAGTGRATRVVPD
jgi:uridylate kinase